MKSDWMAASSFSRSREVISAINMISIHAKLALGGEKDPHDEAELRNARERLTNFLRDFGGLVEQATTNQDGIIIGSDPRIAELAQMFISERQQLPQKSPLFKLPLQNLISLVQSDNLQEMPDLISSLRDLRNILEQHSHSDIVGILG